MAVQGDNMHLEFSDDKVMDINLNKFFPCTNKEFVSFLKVAREAINYSDDELREWFAMGLARSQVVLKNEDERLKHLGAEMRKAYDEYSKLQDLYATVRVDKYRAEREYKWFVKKSEF